MRNKKIKAVNAPAFCRHLELLGKINTINSGPYAYDVWEKLNRLENKAHRLTTLLCNECTEQEQETAEKNLELIENKVKKLLTIPDIFINMDCRGYALKVKEQTARELKMWQDMGGYGILAPEF
jgi:cell wall assembly regulator SMI1